MFQETIVRFLIGGIIVSAFAVFGNLFKPKTFAGLFGAAPSVAIATLILTVAKNGRSYAGTESRSMVAGAVALCFVQYLCRVPAHSISSTGAYRNTVVDRRMVLRGLRTLVRLFEIGRHGGQIRQFGPS